MTCFENPVPRDITTPHLGPAVAIEVTKKPSLHFLLIHLKGNESLTLYDCWIYWVPEIHDLS
jgi:hypothetical protein